MEITLREQFLNLPVLWTTHICQQIPHSVHTSLYFILFKQVWYRFAYPGRIEYSLAWARYEPKEKEPRLRLHVTVSTSSIYAIACSIDEVINVFAYSLARKGQHLRESIDSRRPYSFAPCYTRSDDSPQQSRTFRALIKSVVNVLD